jgi:hypothetical protein
MGLAHIPGPDSKRVVVVELAAITITITTTQSK